jgi:hypothetical protein
VIPLSCHYSTCDPTKMPLFHAYLYGFALLRFDFEYSDLVQWLGGEYWVASTLVDFGTKSFRMLYSLCIWPPPLDLSSPQFDCCSRICTEGVPFEGYFSMSTALNCVRACWIITWQCATSVDVARKRKSCFISTSHDYLSVSFMLLY